MNSAPAFPPASARNMALLVQLRWMAVFGQLVTIWVARHLFGISLPLVELVAVPVLLAMINLSTMVIGREREGYTYLELLGALMLDVLALAWQLYFTGGTNNPFAFLFLLQIVIGAILLPPSWSWIVAAAASLAFIVLTAVARPLVLPARHAGHPMQIYVFGSVVCFLLIAALLVFFVIRIDRNRRQSDAALATLRQQAAEEHHIVRMGLLASGAAHELGTPMATMSVLVGDWQKHPAIRANPELQEELAEMNAELLRCKRIVSGILMSAGEARGENPAAMPLSGFLSAIASEWAERTSGAVRWIDELEEDFQIISDPALRQVIGNVIDNAVEVSPAFVEIRSRLAGDALELDILDRGPGFSQEMMDAFGRPYSSTKGRDGGGLGLFLVVNVVRKLGGKVEVSNPETGGALVRLSIPLAALASGGRVPK
ncbi:MAG TPA: ATP-binding protein [Sphingomonadaceae bacterium]|nr:ATP-binding protein [Sphingomonadaceae bacterium]